jgi:signal peptidase II
MLIASGCAGLLDCASRAGYRELLARDRIGQRTRIFNMSHRSFRTWLIAIALLGVAVDQAGKYLVFRWLYQPAHFDKLNLKGESQVVEGVFRLYAQYTNDKAEGALRSWSADLMPHVNKGALFGLGNGGAKPFGKGIQVAPGDANNFFAAVSVVAGLAIVGWSFRRTGTGDRLLCIALGLILAGTLGNLYDRIVFSGVRDFLYFHLIEWPVFNLADCCLVVGAFLLLGQAFLTRPGQNASQAAVTQPVSEPVVGTPQVARLG